MCDVYVFLPGLWCSYIMICTRPQVPVLRKRIGSTAFRNPHAELDTKHRVGACCDEFTNSIGYHHRMSLFRVSEYCWGFTALYPTLVGYH
jgi:hypothetical protein